MHRFVCNVKNVPFAWRKRVLFLKLRFGKVREFYFLCIGHEYCMILGHTPTSQNLWATFHVERARIGSPQYSRVSQLSTLARTRGVGRVSSDRPVDGSGSIVAERAGACDAVVIIDS